MAFNPFSVFRRNQKTLFAVLTVFVMIMFTLSFGAGDIFDRIPRWLGSTRKTGEVMAVVGGSKVYESELHKQRESRTIANQFMAQANAVAANNTYQVVKSGVGAASQPTKETVNQVVSMHDILGSERLEPRMLQFLLQSYQESEGRLAAIAADTTKPRDDQEVARAAQHLILLDLQNLFSASQGAYFTSQPNRSNRDLLEFELWRRKAEKLGINYTAEDARELMKREFFGNFGDNDFKELEAQYQKNKQGYSKDRLEQALADEFKVRAAQTVVLGPVTARTPNPGVQAFSTPYDDYQYFREQCVGGTYGVIAVPVENYVPQVTGQPTESELREIFQKYRNAEPNPAVETPGLKEPRKLKLQWLEVRGDEPFYKTAAETTLKQAEAQAKLAGFLVPPLGPAAAGLLAAPAPFVVGDPALHTAYEDYKRRFKLEVDTNLFPTFFGSHRVVGPDVVKPATLAAAAGAAAGSLLTGGGPFTAGLVLEQRSAVEARNQRARIQAALLTNPFVPGAGIGVPLGSVAAALARLPQPLPLDVMRAELQTKTKADLARRLAEQDLEKFQADLSKLKLDAKKDKSEARALVEAFVKDRGLKAGLSAQFHDQYTIEKDPGLAPLREKMDRGHVTANAPLRFGGEFFFEMNPRTRRAEPANTFYAPQPYPQTGMVIPGFPMPISVREGEPTYLVWRTEEVPAEAPRSFEAAKDKALAAWKESKARDLAKQAAEDLAKRAEKFGNQPGTVDKELRDLSVEFANRFTDPAAKERAKYFLLDNVCPLPPTPSLGSNFMPGRSQYEPYQLRATKDMPYPTQQILDELLKNKDKPFSTALVLPDAGKDVYYVAVLKDRRDVGVDEFYTKVYSGFDQLGQILNNQHRTEELQKAREEAVALLKAEFGVSQEHAKLNEKVDSSFE